MRRSVVGPWNTTWPAPGCGAGIGGIDVDGAEVDGAEVDGAEVDGVEVDGVEVDGVEVDGAEVDAPPPALRVGVVGEVVGGAHPVSTEAMPRASMPSRCRRP
jgi:hypothetical protein